MIRQLLVVLGPEVAVHGIGAFLALLLVVGMAVMMDRAEASRALRADVDASLTAAGKHGHLADHVIGIGAPKLSRALNAGEPLNLWRLAMLPDVFWLTLAERIATRYGAALIRPQDVELLRGAAHLNLSPKKMARMVGVVSTPERQSA